MQCINDIREIKRSLVSAMKADIDSKGVCGLDVEEAGQAADMIKDLAEAEEKCMKAKYYMTLICAMDKADEALDDMDPEDVEEMYRNLMQDNRRGYNPNRSSRTGRYMSNSSSNRGRSNPGSANVNHMRGYNPPKDYDYMPENMNGIPYDHDEATRTGGERFGRPYNEYRAMRRNYTESHSKEDKERMEHHAKEHVDDAISTMKDIWNNSDPELRKKMKTDLTGLLATMN